MTRHDYFPDPVADFGGLDGSTGPEALPLLAKVGFFGGLIGGARGAGWPLNDPSNFGFDPSNFPFTPSNFCAWLVAVRKDSASSRPMRKGLPSWPWPS